MKEGKISRRQFIQTGAMVAGSAVLAACAPTATQAPASPTQAPQPTMAPAEPTATTAAAAAAQPTATTAAAAPAKLTAEELLIKAGLKLPGAPDNPKGWKVLFPAVPDGMPLSTALQISSARRVDSTVSFPEGDGVDNNYFTRYMKAILGIEWKAAWTMIGDDDVIQKYNTAMAANDLPDVCEGVSGNVLVKMYEADMVEDINDAFENTASKEWVKDKWAPYGALPWSYASYNGRKMGIPYVERLVQNDKLMWIRQDWLDKLSLKAPTTIDELYTVASAFKKAELGQGAKGTTLGLAAQQELGYSWYASFDPIFGAMTGTLPGYWTDDGTGKLATGSINPKMKDALTLLAKWYKEGLIPQDFSTRPTAEAEKLIAGNQAGIHFTPNWDGGWGCSESKKNDPTAQWVPMDVPAGPAGKKKHWSNPFTPTVWPMRKGVGGDKVEAFLKQTNFLAEWAENPENRATMNPGIEGVTFEIKDGKTVAISNLSFMKWAYGTVMGTGGGGVDPKRDINLLRYRLDNWGKIAEADRDAEQSTFFDDPTGAATLNNTALLLADKVAEEEAIKNLYNALPTVTMVDLGTDLGTSGGANSQLGTLCVETFTSIITGQKPVEAFDEFVANWTKLGGDKITAEVNDWYQSHKA
jgi:putative aldouronate transport system substrate-binding protein